MSVPVHKRSESNKVYYDNFQKIFNTIFYFTTKDFGIKTVNRDLRTFCFNAKMSEEDRHNFTDLCDKYKIDVESEYPMWVIEKFRDQIIDTLFDTLHKMTEADNIYPATEYEYNLKRSYQHDCIGNMNYILQLFQKLTILYKVNAEKYTKIVEAIDKNIEQLRKWKKFTNSQYKNALANKAKEINQNKLTISTSQKEISRPYIYEDHIVSKPISFISDKTVVKQKIYNNHIIENPITFINNKSKASA